jgi:hypothetical protein
MCVCVQKVVSLADMHAVQSETYMNVALEWGNCGTLCFFRRLHPLAEQLQFLPAVAN